MASDRSFVEYICEQGSGAGLLTFKAMFGEYALYCDGKVVAFICDNQLFLKPTIAGRALLRKPTEAPPYPGAKNYFLIDEALDDRQVIATLIRKTADELPTPKPKKSKKLD